MSTEIIVTIIGVTSSITNIIFGYLALKRSNRKEERVEGKNEGEMIADIGYIKSCVERVEKNLNKVDERYRNIIERIARLEETVANVTKRVDKIQKIEEA